MTARASRLSTNRLRLIQLIHIAKGQLDLDDDTYRAVLEQTTGKTSSKDLTIQQLDAVLTRLKAGGFEVRSKNQTIKPADDDQSKLIRHLWLLLHAAGEVRNSSEQALAAYVKRTTKVSALQFLSTDSASKVIESLKKWCDRADIQFIRQDTTVLAEE